MLLLTALGACGDSAGTVTLAGTEPPIMVHDLRGGGMDAGLDGYLRYVEEPGCFLVESEPGSGPEGQTYRDPVAWPPDTWVVIRQGEVAGLAVPGFGEIAAGNWVSLGGGGSPAAEFPPELPDECLGTQQRSGSVFLVTQVSSASDAPVAGR